MHFDFDQIVPRRGTNSVKWDVPEKEGVIPMWVADMDFRTAPPIIEALSERVAHGIYGYAKVPEAYYEAIVGWFERRHGWSIDPRWIIYTTGVVPAISAIIKALTQPGDKVIIQPPVYNCFYSSIRNTGCTALANPLRNEAGNYSIDFEDLEEKASDERARLLLLCNPHNPAGRVWTPEELRRVGEICRQHGVIVVSDEIHCELTRPGREYTPFATLSPEFEAHCVVCNSPSKAFNLAGMQTANIIAPDPEMRQRIDRAINIHEVCDISPFGITALIAAYNQGAEWLDALREYLWENERVARAYLSAELPDCILSPLEGTYLLWLDYRRRSDMAADALAQKLLEHGLMISPGTLYDPTHGNGFLRINIACPRAQMLEGLKRLKEVFDTL